MSKMGQTRKPAAQGVNQVLESLEDPGWGKLDSFLHSRPREVGQPGRPPSAGGHVSPTCRVSGCPLSRSFSARLPASQA